MQTLTSTRTCFIYIKLHITSLKFEILKQTLKLYSYIYFHFLSLVLNKSFFLFFLFKKIILLKQNNFALLTLF
jgi:hypothetical protein